MLKDGLAVLVGYFVMAVWVMVGFSLAWVLLGQEFAFVEGTTRVTMGWLVMALGLSLVGAVLGGLVTAMMTRRTDLVPVKVLAGVVLVVGLLMAVVEATTGGSRSSEPGGARTEAEEVDTYEAASVAQEPLWYSFVLPLIGAAGVLAGGRLRRPGSRERLATEPQV